MRYVPILLCALLLGACSTSARGVAMQDGKSVQGFDGRYFYAEGTGTFDGFIDQKTGELLLPPVHFGGDYRIGFDLRTRKKMDADAAKSLVFPLGIPPVPGP